ncbi:MAG: SGNH/GDSL hydrolase family protein [Candidatus Korobacteraceae bacterium]
MTTWATSQDLVYVEDSPETAARLRTPRFPAYIETLKNQTARMVVRTSIGGRRLRVQLSNAFGKPPLEVGSAHVAVRRKDSAIAPGSDRALTFSRSSSVVIPPGGVVVSDPVDLEFAPLSDLTVSLYLPGDTGPPTKHIFGLHTTYVSKEGDHAGSSEITDATTTASYFWLSAIHVVAAPDSGTIVALGDSITDGDRSSTDTNSMWPAVLAARMAASKSTAKFAVVNAGISGNRVLTDSDGIGGKSALSRLDRDVLSLPGVRWIILLEGINDAARPGLLGKLVTSEDLIAGHRQIIARAHMNGIRIAGATLTPANNANPEREAARAGLNHWIRTSGEYDAVIDFEAAVRDPQNPRRFRDELQADGLHPNDAGYKAMGNAVDLSIFEGAPVWKPMAPAQQRSQGARQ